MLLPYQTDYPSYHPKSPCGVCRVARLIHTRARVLTDANLVPCGSQANPADMESMIR